MVDIFALALSHGLLALAVWRLLARGELDVEPLADRKEPVLAKGDAPSVLRRGRPRMKVSARPLVEEPRGDA